MKLVAITGLSKESISDLKRRYLLTFEFHSANNVVAFSDNVRGRHGVPHGCDPVGPD